MEVLQTAVCGNHVLFGSEAAGFGKKYLFLGEVFLEIVVAEFLVDFKIVGVALAGFLEALPHGGIFRGVYVANGIELVLELAVAGEACGSHCRYLRRGL